MSFGEWPQLQDSEWNHLESFGFGAGFNFLPAPYLPPSIANENQLESHSCPRESYEIFRDLICSAPSLHAPGSNTTTVCAQLDEVLQFNRNAMSRLSQVLKCPCAKSGHQAMGHASIVSRILIWYQQAAGWTGSSSWGARSTTLSGASTSSSSPRSPPMVDHARNQPSLVQATGFSVEHVPLSIGRFSIEDENVQGAFRNRLVLSELKRIEELIKLFTSQDEGFSSASMPSLYSHLGTWLQSEYTRTGTILRTRLRTLNEASDP